MQSQKPPQYGLLSYVLPFMMCVENGNCSSIAVEILSFISPGTQPS